MCEYALRKHSESTGRVPCWLLRRLLRQSLSCRRRLARRPGGREHTAREGAWFGSGSPVAAGGTREGASRLARGEQVSAYG